jgi:hypothetical protein
MILFMLTFLEVKTLNVTYYCNLLKGKVKPAMGTERHKQLPNKIVIVQDIACLHSAQVTDSALDELGCEMLSPTLHSPDMLPCDFCVFGSFRSTWEASSSTPVKD